jgi:hypothetical protein
MEQVQHTCSNRGIDHDDQKTDTVSPGNGRDLNDGECFVLRMGEQNPWESQKTKIRPDVLEAHPDEGSCKQSDSPGASPPDETTRQPEEPTQ